MRLFSSTFALMLALLVAFDLFVGGVRPLRWVNHTGLTTINQDSIVSKLPELMVSPQNKDVLLLGSSLVLVPSVRCDDKLHGIKTRYDHWYFRNYINEHSKADYFEQQVAQRLGKPVTVCNAAIAASVTSDFYLIAQKYLASGKRPKLVVVCVAPREFYDNNRARIDKTPTYSILADFSSLPDLIAQRAEFSRIADTAVGMGWKFYGTRQDYKNFFARLTSRVTGQPISESDKKVISAQTKGRKDERVLEAAREVVYDQPENMLYDIPGYKKMYLPINEPQWKAQTEYFRKLLTMLKEKNLPVLVVDMPVTKENYAILPTEALTNYKQFIAQTTREFGVPLLPLADSMTFNTKKEFEDSAHMNTAGGQRLFTAIAEGITSQPQLASVLNDNKQLAVGPKKSF